ncbi:MAG: caspase family protein [Pseudomonadales bacterium]
MTVCIVISDEFVTTSDEHEQKDHRMFYIYCMFSRLRVARFLLLLAIAGVVCSVFFNTAALAFDRAALVIGNSQYNKIAPLPNAVEDARAVARKFTELGFEVITRFDLKRGEIERAFQEFADLAANGDVAVFYYAGHAVQLNGNNYFLPVDIDIDDVLDGKQYRSTVLQKAMQQRGFDVHKVLGTMKAARANRNILILDACRDNPFGLPSGAGLAEVDGIEGSLLVYATKPGKRAWDGLEGTHSLYTAALLEHMGTPGLSVHEMFNRAGLDVSVLTDGQQVPWMSSAPIEDFCFANCLALEAVVDSALLSQSNADAKSLINRFMSALQKKDMGTLRRISQMTPSQDQLLSGIFGTFSNLKVESTGYKLIDRGNYASTLVSITEARNASSNKIIPSAEWGKMLIQLRKNNGRWEPVTWF